MRYLIKSPWLFQKLWPSYIWHIKTNEKIIYLSFDDGPHPVATTFVLDELKKYNAKATFFCIGQNVIDQPALYKRILEEGHAVGNHTQHHLNGWKTKNDIYLQDVATAATYIDTNLFRPPYGRIRSSQAKQIPAIMKNNNARIIMWSVLSGDFDEAISPEQCYHNVTDHTKQGSIVVFHDSEKAFTRLSYALPLTLHYFQEKGYRFEAL